ncbi:hypothetical protein JCGZ_19341 [Jatropha curcas]|uniref:Uncharacterized protein n=1 Tax=Jatropha curcas TaxID=180498 RepID=A0A067K042_JATCU|nr:hypothetical protein JCGZ_19341 [Jatropha curcas]
MFSGPPGGFSTKTGGVSDSEALDMAVVVGKPENGFGVSFSFILDCTGQNAQGMLETHLVSIFDYNEACQLYEAARLKLVVARLSDEHVSVNIQNNNRENMQCTCHVCMKCGY